MPSRNILWKTTYYSAICRSFGYLTRSPSPEQPLYCLNIGLTPEHLSLINWLMRLAPCYQSCGAVIEVAFVGEILTKQCRYSAKQWTRQSFSLQWPEWPDSRTSSSTHVYGSAIWLCRSADTQTLEVANYTSLYDNCHVNVYKTRCRAKPNVSPPGCATIRPCSTNTIYRMSPELSSVDKTNKNWLPWQCLLRDRRTNFRLIIYSHNSTTLKIRRRSVWWMWA